MSRFALRSSSASKIVSIKEEAGGTEVTADPKLQDYSETGWTGGYNPWLIAFVVT